MQSAERRNGQARDFRIDCLRGLSILSVLLLHFQIAYKLLLSPLGRFLPEPYLSNLVWNGNYGVTVFFVISGYLITSTSLRRFGTLGKVSLKTFYAFRFARIVPCLVLVLAVIAFLAKFGVAIFAGDGQVSLWLAELSVLTFWHNILMAKFGYFNYCLNIFWSLSVEEVFYLVFPLLCLTLRRQRWIMLVWMTAVVAGPIYRSLNNRDEIKFLYGNLACFDAIAMGCLTAVLVARTQIRAELRNGLQGIALAGMVFIFLRAGIDSVPVWGPSWMACGAAVFLFAEGAAKNNGLADSRASLLHSFAAPVAWLGRRSYELYLFHIVLLAGLMTILKPRNMEPAAKPLWLVFFVAVSAFIAWIIAKYYSEPMNKVLRQRLTART